MTNQEFNERINRDFQRVKTHLLTQRAKSQTPDKDTAAGFICQYRSPDGLSCAVGCLIPDDKYYPDFDPGSIWGLLCRDPATRERRARVLAALDMLTMGEKQQYKYQRFLEELQSIHDNNSVSTWEEDLNLFENKLHSFYR